MLCCYLNVFVFLYLWMHRCQHSLKFPSNLWVVWVGYTSVSKKFPLLASPGLYLGIFVHIYEDVNVKNLRQWPRWYNTLVRLSHVSFSVLCLIGVSVVRPAPYWYLWQPISMGSPKLSVHGFLLKILGTNTLAYFAIASVNKRFT
jgi:hypothetical protein